MVTDEAGAERPRDWISEADALVGRWTSVTPGDEDRALGTLWDDSSRAFVAGALDAVLRPRTLSGAASGLHGLPATLSSALPWSLRSAVRLSGAVAPLAPAAVVPLSRRAVRGLVADVVADAAPGPLGSLLTRLRSEGRRVTVAPVVPRPAGDDEARAHRDDLTALLADPQVDTVSVRVASLVGIRSPWAFDDTVGEIVAAITAARGTASTRLQLAALSIDDLEITLAVLDALAADPECATLPLGIALAAELPAIIPALAHVLETARSRARAGGSVLHVVIDAGHRSVEDRAEAAVHGWEPAAATDPVDVAAVLLRALRLATDEPTVRVSVTDHDVRRLALATAWARAHDAAVELELAWSDLGALAAVVADAGPHPVVRVPIATRGRDDVAVARAVRGMVDERRPDTEAPAELFALAQERSRVEPRPAARTPDRTHPGAVRPDTRLVRAPSAGDDGLTQEVIGIARAQVTTETSPIAPEAADLLFGGTPLVETAVFQEKEDAVPARGVAGFRSAPDTDPTTPANRAWVRAILGRIPAETRMLPASDRDAATAMTLHERVRAVAAAADSWGTTPAVERAAVLRRIAREWDVARADLIETAAGESGALPVDTDADVTTAIDAAVYAASCAGELDATAGARFVPAVVTVVTTGEVAATADLADGLATALATGSGVVLHPAARARGVAAVLRAAAIAAGLDEHLITVVADGDPDPLTFDEIDQVISSGDGSYAHDVSLARRDVRVSSRAQTTAVAIVAPSADLDRAAVDIVTAGFARAGRAAHNTSVVIVLGSAGRSRAFATRLADVARTWRPGFPEDPRALIGPFPADERTDAALGAPEGGESWLVEPVSTPDGLRGGGIRIGTELGARFTRERPEAPLISVLAATTLSEAIDWQNGDRRGAHATLYTRDERDLAVWLHTVEAGTLTVNAPARAPRAGRRPAPAWNPDSLGSAAAVAGPHRLVGLGAWRASQGGHGSSTLHLRGLDSRITALIEAAQPELDYNAYDRVRRGALSDAVAWDRDFGRVKDVSGLVVERNLLRYRRVPVAVRAGADAPLADVLRVVLAAVRARSVATLSLATGLPAAVRHALGDADVTMFVETDDEWITRVRASAVTRVRLIGDEARGLEDRLRGDGGPAVAVFADEVTTAGRLELLPFLREQAITIAADRDGALDRWSDSVI